MSQSDFSPLGCTLKTVPSTRGDPCPGFGNLRRSRDPRVASGKECSCDTPWEQKHLLWACVAHVTCVDLAPSTSASRSWGGVPMREHVIRGGWPVSPAPVEGQGETRGGARIRLSPQGPGQTRLARGDSVHGGAGGLGAQREGPHPACLGPRRDPGPVGAGNVGTAAWGSEPSSGVGCRIGAEARSKPPPRRCASTWVAGRGREQGDVY